MSASFVMCTHEHDELIWVLLLAFFPIATEKKNWTKKWKYKHFLNGKRDLTEMQKSGWNF